MSLKKKDKRLDWWIERFGDKAGKKYFIEQQKHKRRRTIEIIKTLSGITFLLKLIGR